MIAGSSLWTVKADPQKAAKPEISESLESNTAQQAFEAERQAIKTLLGMDGMALLDKPDGYYPRPSLAEVLAKLTELDDAEVLRVLSFLMADSLAVGGELVEVLAQSFETDIAATWTIDDTFFDLMRDKQSMAWWVKSRATLPRRNILLRQPRCRNPSSRLASMACVHISSGNQM